MSLGLKTTKLAMEKMDDNGHRPYTVHVAGSNGKGTLCATLTAALRAVESKSLMFSSPHLVRVEERFRIDGVPVASDVLDQALLEVQSIDITMNGVLTFFEITFLVAVHLARRERVEVLVLETGLGGRLDATRCAPADLAVVTSLALEHTDVLGGSLEEIAHEKAAIARPGRPIIVRRPDQASVKRQIEHTVKSAGQALLGERSKPANLEWVDVPPQTSYAEEALLLCRALWHHLPQSSEESMPSINELHWPARMQTLPSPNPASPSWILEGAHNQSGMKRVASELLERPFVSGPWVLLFGSTPQDSLPDMIDPLVRIMTAHPPLEVVVTEPQGGRYLGVPSEVWQEVFRPRVACPVTCIPAPLEAVRHCQIAHDANVTVLSIGSLYMQGNVLEALEAATDEHLSVHAKA